MDIEAFFKISYGLYIISTFAGDRKNGYIGNTVFQVTADPPQMAVACNKNNFTGPMLHNSKFFSISVLKQNTRPDILGLFGYKSGRQVDKFERIHYKTGQTGVPIVLEDTIAWFECEKIQEVDLGTHILYVGKVLDNELLERDETPLTYAYYHEVKKGFAPKNAPTYVDQSKLKQDKPKPSGDITRYQCAACDYIYDPAQGDEANGIAPGTAFGDLPDGWFCPVCGATKKEFKPIQA
jgi:flavin reductase (DIM6/NTAB) family NADH-FMN oxidoreductase RutF/rubredoxin